MSLIIGLTGSIGTGKSTISHMFKERGIPVVDADLIAREVVEPGQPAYEAIVRVFTEKVLRADGTLDRKALGAIIFANEAERSKLNAIIHPAIREEMLRQRDAYVADGAGCVVMDIPLLFESKLTDYVDKIIVVTVDENVQLQRITARDGSSIEEAKRRINSQIPVIEKVKLADLVIDNNGTKKETCHQFEQLLTTLSNL